MTNFDSDRGPDDTVQETGHVGQRQDGPRRWFAGGPPPDPVDFLGGSLELSLRAEEHRIGRVAPSGPNDYTVQTGPDTTPSSALKRACWNLQGSIAYGGVD